MGCGYREVVGLGARAELEELSEVRRQDRDVTRHVPARVKER